MQGPWNTVWNRALINPHGTVMWYEQGINLYRVLSHQNLIWGLFQYLVLVTIKIRLGFVSWYYCAQKHLTWKQRMLQPNVPMAASSLLKTDSFCPTHTSLVLTHRPNECLSGIVWSHMHIKTTYKHTIFLERWGVPGIYYASETCLGDCLPWA